MYIAIKEVKRAKDDDKVIIHKKDDGWDDNQHIYKDHTL